MNVVSSRGLALAAVLGMSLFSLSGCYKSEMEAQKTRADDAEKKLAEVNAKLDAANATLTKTQASARQFDAMKNGARLAVVVNGQKVGYDEIRLADSGEFMRNGVRQRAGSAVRFTDGRLLDQQLIVNRDSGKKLVEGMIKNSRCDGDWIWYDREGKPAFKEVWKDGRLSDLMKAEITKAKAPTPPKKPANGATPPAVTPPPPAEVVNWKAATKAEKDERIGRTIAVFAALPELIRE